MIISSELRMIVTLSEEPLFAHYLSSLIETFKLYKSVLTARFNGLQLFLVAEKFTLIPFWFGGSMHLNNTVQQTYRNTCCYFARYG